MKSIVITSEQLNTLISSHSLYLPDGQLIIVRDLKEDIEKFKYHKPKYIPDIFGQKRKTK